MPAVHARIPRRALGALACSVAAIAGCRDQGEPDRGEGLGKAVGEALAAGLGAAEATRAPWPCSLDGQGPVTAPQGWTAQGDVLAPSAPATTATVGVIADGGAADDATLAVLRRAAARLGDEGATVVLSLGGLARSEAEIRAALEALVSDRYLLIASPGDLEPVPAHRAAVDALARGGARIVDGSRVRIVELGVAAIALVPGVRAAAQSPAGDDACGFDAASLEHVAARLARSAGLHVVASWAAPRAGSPLAARGDLLLAQVLGRAGVELAIVGEPTGRGEMSGQGRDGDALQVVGAGFIDGAPRPPVEGMLPHPVGLRLQLATRSWRWQRLDLSLQPTP